MKQTRRKFLAQASAIGAGMTLPGMAMKPEALQHQAKEGFGIKVYLGKWGFQGSNDDFCKRVKEEGFDGVEVWIPNDKAGKESLFEAIEKYNLRFASMAGTGGDDGASHVNSLSRGLDYIVTMKPDYINCHAGRDFFSFEENRKIVEVGIQKSKEHGVPVYQETHRGRMLFASHICEKFIDAYPELKLTLDISHWCVVAETLLENQKEIVDKALNCSEHIHARIGHKEGAQVSEPRAPEWKKEVEAHYAWWDAIVARKKSLGQVLTVKPEFGPPNYMWTTPYTRQPLANLWNINVHMMNDWRKRYL